MHGMLSSSAIFSTHTAVSRLLGRFRGIEVHEFEFATAE